MFVLIVGCGRVGSSVARAMLREGHSVSCLDEDPESHARLEVGLEKSWEDLGGQFGLLVVGTAAAEAPFQGGTLCVAPAVARVAPRLSGGNPGGVDCSGALRVDVNALLGTGALPGVAAGDELFVQWWYRDPGDATGYGLSDALRFFVCP